MSARVSQSEKWKERRLTNSVMLPSWLQGPTCSRRRSRQGSLGRLTELRDSEPAVSRASYRHCVLQLKEKGLKQKKKENEKEEEYRGVKERKKRKTLKEK
jgi:hypothetical protein